MLLSRHSWDSNGRDSYAVRWIVGSVRWLSWRSLSEVLYPIWGGKGNLGAFVGILFLVGIGVICALVSSARTSARKASNAITRSSLNVTSDQSAEQLSAIIARGLAGAGLRESGSFDGTRFFRLNSVTQLELRVWDEDGQSHARVYLPSVRSQSGRPQKLAPVGNALAAAERSVRSADPGATIS
jgi:hypothetical protein